MSARPENIGIKAIEIYFPNQVCNVFVVAQVPFGPASKLLFSRDDYFPFE